MTPARRLVCVYVRVHVLLPTLSLHRLRCYLAVRRDVPRAGEADAEGALLPWGTDRKRAKCATSVRGAATCGCPPDKHDATTSSLSISADLRPHRHCRVGLFHGSSPNAARDYSLRLGSGVVSADVKLHARELLLCLTRDLPSPTPTFGQCGTFTLCRAHCRWEIPPAGVGAILYAGLLSSALNYSMMAWVNKRTSPVLVMAFYPLQVRGGADSAVPTFVAFVTGYGLASLDRQSNVCALILHGHRRRIPRPTSPLGPCSPHSHRSCRGTSSGTCPARRTRSAALSSSRA